MTRTHGLPHSTNDNEGIPLIRRYSVGTVAIFYRLLLRLHTQPMFVEFFPVPITGPNEGSDQGCIIVDDTSGLG
jgi:hypothetical protein